MTEPKDTIEAGTKAAHTVGQIPSGNLAMLLTTGIAASVLFIGWHVLGEISDSVERSAEAMEKLVENDIKETELFREFVDVMTEREQ